MTGDFALQIHGLRAGYSGSVVLNGIDLDVRSGEICTLLGANGAGKTTTLKAIVGLVRSQGSIECFGKSISGASPEKNVRTGVALVPEGRGTFPGLSVEDNLRAGATRHHRREIPTLLQEWFGVFPRLAERRWQKAGTLSGGEQQMLAIARAMMSRPRLLLLDEPSMGLAPQITAQLFNDLQAINRRTGTALLIVEQNANLALEVASRAFVLTEGRVGLSGSASDIAADEGVKKAYLHA